MRTHRLVSSVLPVVLLLTAVTPAWAATASSTKAPEVGDRVVLLRSYKTSPASVLVGSRFALSLVLKNRARTRLREVTAVLGSVPDSMSVGSDVSASSAGVQPFGYLGSGNIEFLGDVAAGRTATVTFKLIADPRTAPGSYVVPVTIEYKFQDVPQTMTTDVAVVVGRDASFYVDGLEAPIRMTAGGSATAKVEAVNSGTFAVSGVSMSLGGDGLNVTDGQLYVGELNQGDGDVLQSQIKAVSPGVHQLRFVLRYLDDFGRPRSVTRSTQVVVATGTASAPTPSDNSQPSIFKRLLSFIGGLFGLGS